MISKEQAVKNLDEIITKNEFARIQVNAHHIVQIVGVSKYNTSEDIKTLYSVGQRAFGENKVQDLKEKSQILKNIILI